jgi:hydroxypyruvate isomerase
VNRRDAVRAGLGAAALGVLPARAGAVERVPAIIDPRAWTGGAAAPFKHSVCRWCYPKLSVDELARAAKTLDMHSVELLEPDEWRVAKQHGLTCAMGYATVPEPGARLTKGWNRTEHHAWLVPAYERAIPLAAAAGIPNLICFSGNREGLGDDEGLENCAKGLAAVMPAAERHRVTLCMELLNSKVDHPDYQCDHTAWGVALARRVGSERFKLLYDIYHMQIMEGDVIRTVRDNRDYIAHFHTAGVPGRHEIDGSQELHYPAIMRAIAETGFAGYVAQEFIPTRAPLASLAEAVRICRV